MSRRDNRPDRPVFCGNFEYDASPREVERMFDRYGPLERVDMKTGFAFVYMRDRRDGEDAIRALDGKEFGYRRRRLRVEWAKGDGDVKRREDTRRRNQAPTTTLFVVNFDPVRTSERDLERLFEEFGRLRRVQIKRNYAFVQYENVDQATAAVKATHLTDFFGRVISVEFVAREPDGRSIDQDRGRSMSPGRGRARSRSPDYGRRSPTPRRSRSRSPVRRSFSQSPYRSLSRSPDRNGRRSISRSLTP